MGAVIWAEAVTGAAVKALKAVHAAVKQIEAAVDHIAVAV